MCPAETKCHVPGILLRVQLDDIILYTIVLAILEE